MAKELHIAPFDIKTRCNLISQFQHNYSQKILSQEERFNVYKHLDH